MVAKSSDVASIPAAVACDIYDMSTVADVPSVAGNPAVASIPSCCCLSVKILRYLLLLVAHRMLIVAGDPYVAKNTAVANVPAALDCPLYS
jgi:hypothetical protein